MIAAARTPDRRNTKLLILEGTTTRTGPIGDLVDLARPGDVWVVNDAATFPASLVGATGHGEAIELRLLPHRAGDPTWQAIAFGSGDWRMRTEDRPPPPTLRPGDALRFGRALDATVRRVSARAPRFVECTFAGSEADVWAGIYGEGRPIQYSYQERPFDLWSVQTTYAGRPWASEMPSAGRPLTWELLRALRDRGATLGFLTHATGLSSTGDPTLDAALPLPEFFEIPSETVEAIRAAKSRNGRVVAVGTSVLRALEGCARSPGGFRAGGGETSLKMTATSPRAIVDGILSGLHVRGETHFELLASFVPETRLESAIELAEKAGFLGHEFGDSMIVLP